MNPKHFVTKVTIKYQPLEKVMNETDRKLTGLTKLTPDELFALNEWLDQNAVLAPGDPPKDPG